MRRIATGLVILAALLCCPAAARATIFVQFPFFEMSQNTSVVVPITITADAGEQIHSVDLFLQIEDGMSGPFPFVADIDLLTGTIFDAVPSTQFEYGDPFNVENGISTGYKIAYGAHADALTGPDANVPANGALAYLKITALNDVPTGVYNVSFAPDEVGPTQFASTSGSLDYVILNTLFVVAPEPSSIVLGVFSIAALAWLAIRVRRVRPGA
jgi:hypothetical protein